MLLSCFGILPPIECLSRLVEARSEINSVVLFGGKGKLHHSGALYKGCEVGELGLRIRYFGCIKSKEIVSTIWPGLGGMVRFCALDNGSAGFSVVLVLMASVAEH